MIFLRRASGGSGTGSFRVKRGREALRRGRPRAARRKVSVTVRYDEDIVKAFKAKGPGWQTRMNEALGEWLKAHSG